MYAAAGTLGIAGAPMPAGFELDGQHLQRLDPCFQVPDGRLPLLNKLQRVQDQVVHDGPVPNRRHQAKAPLELG
jgi:hypothetical protein